MLKVVNIIVKNKVLISLILIITFLLFLRIKENFEDCENSFNVNDMPGLAKDACNKISSRAEEIEAELKGGAGIVDSIMSFLSPLNYKAGDNNTSSLTRNIINNNLSECEITKISDACNQSSVISQINLIDNTMCKYCDNNLCIYEDITQSNKSANSQSCAMQTAIKILTEKTNSVDAQALAKVLQKTEGVLSGNNTSKTENCNIIANDLSSRKYLETRNECILTALVDQENNFKGCGRFGNIVQKNESKSVQECMVGAEIKSESRVDNNTEVFIKTEVDQKSEGLTMGLAVISSSSCVCVCVLIIIGLGAALSNKEQ